MAIIFNLYFFKDITYNMYSLECLKTTIIIYLVVFVCTYIIPDISNNVQNKA